MLKRSASPLLDSVARLKLEFQSLDGVGCAMDIVTLAVVGLIVVAYVVGSLTSSVETEAELPHVYR
jgi:hypothetical protein